MKLFIKLLPVIFSIFIFSCQKDAVDEFAVFYWEQTKCADPWGTGEGDSDEKTEEAIMNFMSAKQIAVESIEIRQGSSPDIFCEACNCHTGKEIIILVEEESSQKMEEIMNLESDNG